MTRMIRQILCAALVVAGNAMAADPRGALLRIEGPIGPATSGYFEKAHGQAVASGADLIVVQIDTPGGLDGAMRDIIKVILASPVPVAVYVAPGGARAASAGTYILYASHVAAMAPATNVGAATPIPAGGDWPAPGKAKGKDDDPAKAGRNADRDGPVEVPPALGPEGLSAGEVKAVNDAVAYLRSLAEMRGRSADWAERAVREGASLSADQALKAHVIDVVADSPDALLKQLDGRQVTLAGGSVTLKTAGMTLQPFDPDWRMKLLGVITSPTIAYLLLLAGIYGLLLEGYHPGATFPGVVGGICLLLGLYAMHLLPTSYAGLGLLLVGVALMVAEAMTPSFGVLGFGGLVSFVLGSVFLMDTDIPGYGIDLGVILGIALCAAAVLALTLVLLWRARRAPPVTGSDGMVGEVAEMLEPINGEGWARVRGERWRVRSAMPLPAGAKARIARIEGLTLIVASPPNS